MSEDRAFVELCRSVEWAGSVYTTVSAEESALLTASVYLHVVAPLLLYFSLAIVRKYLISNVIFCDFWHPGELPGFLFPAWCNEC